MIPEPKEMPNSVREILHTLHTGIQEALHDNLVGVYLRGSLALGGFDPMTSDIDFLVATKAPITDKEYSKLSECHSEIAKSSNVYSNELEGAYIDCDSLTRYQEGKWYPTVERKGVLQWSKHQHNWILERWTVREHAIVLSGPDPKTLIEPIAETELRSAVTVRLNDWADWADKSEDPAWHLPLSHKAYVVETMCRAMYTLTNGRLCSKEDAVSWALTVFPEPWCSLVKSSQAWRTDTIALPEPGTISEIMQLIHWVNANAKAAKS